MKKTQVLLTILLGGAALAPSGAAQSPPDTGSYETKFELGIGGTFVNADGNEEKFRTDRNIRSGFDTKSLYFDMRPLEGTKSRFDFLTLSVFGIGDSSPYQRGDVRMAKGKLYNLKAHYRKYNYFFGLPEFALGWHPEDSVGRSGDVSLELLPGRTASFLAGYRRNQLYGTRYTSQNLTLDTYPVSFPRRLSSDEIYGGVKLTSRIASLNFTQSYVRFKDDSQLSPNGDRSVGLRGNQLVSGQRDTPTRISNPITRLVGRVRPTRRYDLTGRYMYSGADLDLSQWENLLQTTGQGRFPVQQIVSSSGTSDKPTHNFGLTQTFDITDRLTFHHRLNYNSYSITGLLDTTGILRMINADTGQNLDFPFADMGGTVTDYKLLRNDTELEFFASRAVSLVGGYRYTDRHVGFGERGADPRPVVTIGHTGLGGVIWKAGRKGRVRAEVEKGTASLAFNRRDPLDTLRFKIRGQYKPTNRFTLSGNAVIEDNKNDTPDVNYDLDNRQVGIQAVYLPSDRLLVSGGYNYLRIRTTTDIVFWTLAQLTQGTFGYETNTHAFNAMVKVPVRDRLELRAGYDYYKDTGATFPLNMHIPRAGAALKIHSGFSVEADWRYFSYDERRFAIQDYNAHVVYVGVRYTR